MGEILDARVHMVGSSLTNFATSNSDMDIVLTKSLVRRINHLIVKQQYIFGSRVGLKKSTAPWSQQICKPMLWCIVT